MGDLIVNLTPPLLTVRQGSVRAVPHFILTATTAKGDTIVLYISQMKDLVTERLNHLFNVTELTSGRTSITKIGVWSPNPSS